eukprot:4592950-Pyramimonas_sp.AAC.1
MRCRRGPPPRAEPSGAGQGVPGRGACRALTSTPRSSSSASAGSTTWAQPPTRLRTRCCASRALAALRLCPTYSSVGHRALLVGAGGPGAAAAPPRG